MDFGTAALAENPLEYSGCDLGPGRHSTHAGDFHRLRSLASGTLGADQAIFRGVYSRVVRRKQFIGSRRDFPVSGNWRRDALSRGNSGGVDLVVEPCDRPRLGQFALRIDAP